VVAGSSPPSHARELLDELTKYERSLAQSARLDPQFDPHRLKATIQDRANAVAIRRQAIRLLARHEDQDALDYLCGMLIVEEESALRHEVVRGLVKMRVSQRTLQFPVPLIRRQIAREVSDYERITQIATIYQRHHRGPVPDDDPILALLLVLLEESVDQIFRLLMLLYHPEDIHLVYEQMRTTDTYLRADAIEFLDNLIDPAMRATILPILDEDRFLALVEEERTALPEPTMAFRLLQEAIWDHNCWLSLTTVCAVGRLHLTTMRQELEKASHHAQRLIALAAKVALNFSSST